MEGKNDSRVLAASRLEAAALRARLAALEEKLTALEGVLAAEAEDRARAEAAFRLNEERLDALLKLSEMRDATEDELAHYAIDECVRLTGSKIGYIHFVKRSGVGFISYVWSRGSREVCEAVEYMDYSLDTACIWADTLRTKRPVIHNDYPNEPSRRGLPTGHLPLLRHMGVPVLKEGRVVAVSGVANKEEAYDAADLRQILLFANRLWGIVEARRSEAELAEANRQLSRLASLDGLTGIAESLVAKVSDLGIAHAGSKVVELLTISIGVASLLPSRGEFPNAEALMAAADVALYEAKRGGKNRALLQPR